MATNPADNRRDGAKAIVVSVGVFSTGYVMVALATVVCAGVGAIAARASGNSGRIADRVLQMLLTGLLVARIVFVLQWFELYWKSPWSMLDIRDGGFAFWPGVAAALLVAAFTAWRQPALRRGVLLGTASGGLAWIMLARLLLASQQALTGVAATELSTLEGAPVSLHALGGQPMVVNLWATWCPPCRREMPTLQQAQQDNPAVTFVFANQGEAAETITAYLQQQPLQLDNVLVDSFSALSEAVGSRGLPTTLFFDAEGRLLDSHVGELSAASLAARMQRFEASSRP